MAATDSMAAIMNSESWPTSGNIDRPISESGMMENITVEVGFAALYLIVEKLFPLPVSVATMLNSTVHQYLKILGNVDSVILKSGLVENVWIVVQIASLSQAVQKLLPLSFF